MGDRMKRWQSTCEVQGVLMICIGMLFCTLGDAGIVWGAICILVGLLDLRSATTGWRMSKRRPPWADVHDAIDKAHGPGR